MTSPPTGLPGGSGMSQIGSHRLLKDHTDLIAANFPHFFFRKLQKILAIENDFTANGFARRVGNEPDRKSSAPERSYRSYCREFSAFLLPEASEDPCHRK